MPANEMNSDAAKAAATIFINDHRSEFKHKNGKEAAQFVCAGIGKVVPMSYVLRQLKALDIPTGIRKRGRNPVARGNGVTGRLTKTEQRIEALEGAVTALAITLRQLDSDVAVRVGELLRKPNETAEANQ